MISHVPFYSSSVFWKNIQRYTVGIVFLVILFNTTLAAQTPWTVVKVEDDKRLAPGQGKVVFFDIEGYYYDINGAVLRSVADTTYPVLTPELFGKLHKAATRITELWEKDTAVARHEWVRLVIGVTPVERPKRWKWFWGDDPGFQNIPADSVTAALSRIPPLVNAITEAGLTPAQYVRGVSAFMKTMYMVSMEDAAKAQGRVIPLDSTTVLPKNMLFFRTFARSPGGADQMNAFVAKLSRRPGLIGVKFDLKDELFPDD